MKYLGIDYGHKKIGLATSDERGVLAFPLALLANDEKLFEHLGQYIESEAIEAIVIGKSLTQEGEQNVLQSSIENFSRKLKENFSGLEIFFQDERFSSANARAFLYGKGNIENERWGSTHNKQKRDPIDASAAALILQRYLDKKK